MIHPQRLILNPVSADHLDPLHRLWTLPDVRQYLFDDEIVDRATVQAMITQSQTAFRANQYGLWVAYCQSATSIMGFTGYWPFFDPPQVQLLYGLDPKYWGQGLATEIANAMVNYGWEHHGFTTIVAACDAPHDRSIRVLDRLGFCCQQRQVLSGKVQRFYELAVG